MPIAARLTALGLSLLAMAAAHAFELKGFRGVYWGEGADALRGATVAQTDGDVACHQREHENLIFGDTALDSVRYCFHRDRLVMVMLDAPVARATFSAEFQLAYGSPASQRDGVESWGGSPSATLAVLSSTGSKSSRITLSVSPVDEDAARRMVEMVARSVPAKVAAR